MKLKVSSILGTHHHSRQPQPSDQPDSGNVSIGRKRHAPSPAGRQPHRKHQRLDGDQSTAESRNRSVYNQSVIIEALDRQQLGSPWYAPFTTFASDAWSFVKGLVTAQPSLLAAHQYQQQQQENQRNRTMTTRGEEAVEVDLTQDDSDGDEPELIDPTGASSNAVRQPTTTTPSAHRNAMTSVVHSHPAAANGNGSNGLINLANGDSNDTDEDDDDEPVIVEEHLLPASSSRTSPTQQLSTHTRLSYLSPFIYKNATLQNWSRVTAAAPDYTSRTRLGSSSRGGQQLSCLSAASASSTTSPHQQRVEYNRYARLLDSIGVGRPKPDHHDRGAHSLSPPPPTSPSTRRPARFGSTHRISDNDVKVLFDSHEAKRDRTRKLLNAMVGGDDSGSVAVQLDSPPAETSSAASPSGRDTSPSKSAQSPTAADRPKTPAYSPELIESLKHRFDQFDPQKLIDGARAQNDRYRQQMERCRALKNELAVFREARECRYRRETSEMYLKNRFTDMSILEFPEPLIEDEFPALTAKMEAEIDRVLRGGSPLDVVSKGVECEVNRKDLKSLTGLNWLNDEVINFYMEMLVARSALKSSRARDWPRVYAFNTFFYTKIMEKGHTSVKRWTKRVDIFSYDMIILPVHLGVHWCFALIDFRYRVIRYFDSMGGRNVEGLLALKQYVQDESRDKRKQEYDMHEWDLRCEPDLPQQSNGSDCGVFACRFAEYCTRDAPINFSQKHMPYFRRRTMYEIITKKLML